MLYIFQVDTGQMLCFEMDVAISTVSSLKQKICTSHGIPSEKQVLLVSGGEILEQNSRVCNYAAGTDTNPIFLFNRLNIEGATPADSCVPNNNHLDCPNSASNNLNITDLETIQKQIDQTNSLPPTYMSVVTRAQLAQHVYEMGKEMTRKCEVLIHHQHLQHQGWAAVVANLDDIVSVFTAKLSAFVASHDRFTAEYTDLQVNSYVDSLESTLKVLDTIRIPNHNATAGVVVSSPPSTGSSSSPPKTIVSWLSEHYGAAESVGVTSPSPLEAHVTSLAMSTRKTYDHVTSPNFLSQLKSETNGVIEKASSPNMKEIKGLEERLYGLDQLLQEAKKLVLDQHELTQAFHQNVSRASEQRDNSIFPDLCASHQHQLVVMYKNHSQLEDIRRRCARAKEELTVNLNTRLKWIAFVQKNLSDQSGKISLYNESLKRLRVNVSVLQQIHDCERVFKVYSEEVSARGRVGRRLSKIASGVVEFNSIADGENSRRNNFIDKYSGHFLSQLFSSLIEDREIGRLPVPRLVQYACDHYDDDDDDLVEKVVDNEKVELVAKVKGFEAQVSGLQERNSALESLLAEKSCAFEREVEGLSNVSKELESVRGDLLGKDAVIERLSKQVTDLKHLINEFREKEEETIKLRESEAVEWEERVRVLNDKCNERVVELTRIHEFECAQKIKKVEEEHKLEMDGLLKRFKLMNKSHAVGGSGEIGNWSPAQRKFDSNNALENVNKLVFSDDETGDDEDGCGGGVSSHHCGHHNPIMRTSDERAGSLERAVDAAAALFDEEESSNKNIGVEEAVINNSSNTDAEGAFLVGEHVVSAALRLHKLSRISIQTCRVGGESNLFYWNDKFNAFTVYLNNRNVHFLNTSSNSSEDDRIIKSLSRSQLFLASITDKEFCVARRPQNRYNVPQGFHFYRVKCKVVEVINDDESSSSPRS